MSTSVHSVALATVLPALVLAVCARADEVPTEVAEPSVIGVIEDYEQRGDGAFLELDTGETVLIPPRSRELTGPIETGRLLIVGEGRPPADDGDQWFASIRASPSGCFPIAANGEVRGDRLVLSEGFSVALSEEWDETDARFVDSPPVGFCLNSSGEAVGVWR